MSFPKGEIMRIIFTFLIAHSWAVHASDFRLNNMELKKLLASYNKCVSAFNQSGLDSLISNKCFHLKAEERKVFRGQQRLASLEFNSGYFVFFTQKPLWTIRLQDFLNQDVVLSDGQRMAFLSYDLLDNHQLLSAFLGNAKFIKEKERRSVALSYLLLERMLSRKPEILSRVKRR